MYSSLELKSPKLKSQLNSLGLESAHVDSIASSLRAARPSELLELSQQLDSAEQALSHAVANLESWLSSPLEQNCALPRGGSVLFVKVSPSATKEQIKHSIEERFDVQVAQVSTRTIRVKKVRHGFHFSTKPTWKKAMVRLRENPRIEQRKWVLAS